MEQLVEGSIMSENNWLFALEGVTYTPGVPRVKQPFTVEGKVKLFGLPYLAPAWVVIRVTYPEEWWEEMLPIIGAPSLHEGVMSVGGNFKITFPKGFEREGSYLLEIEVYAGPTYTVNKLTLPPAPPVVRDSTTFVVSGDAIPLPEEVEGADLADPDLRLVKGTYNMGDRVPFTFTFKYQGIEQDGQLVISLGTGPMGTFFEKHRFEPISIKLEYSSVWESRSIEGNIILPTTLEPGQTYSSRVTIEGLEIAVQETDTDWGAFTVAGVPVREADIADFKFNLQRGTYNFGDRVTFSAPYSYKGVAQSGRMVVELGTGTFPTFSSVHKYDPIPVEFKASEDWTVYRLTGSIMLPTTLEKGQMYNTRALLETLDVEAEEVATEWTVFDIVKPPPELPPSDIADWRFEPEKRVYNLGEHVPFRSSYSYKGKSQSGWLTVSLGSGAFPTFLTRHTYPGVPVSFRESMDWASGGLDGSFELPLTLVPGQYYNVRAKLETADGVQEVDTDWGVFSIFKEEAPLPSPEPELPPEPEFPPEFKDFDIYKYTTKPWPGSTCYVHVMFSYRGPAITKELYVSVGKLWAGIFDEIFVARKSIPISRAISWETRLGRAEIRIPYDAQLGRYYVYAKLDGAVPEAISNYYPVDIIE